MRGRRNWHSPTVGDPRGFAERRFFGIYLLEILDRRCDGPCAAVANRAVAALRRHDCWEIALADG